jgi:hypothetical protein
MGFRTRLLTGAVQAGGKYARLETHDDVYRPQAALRQRAAAKRQSSCDGACRAGKGAKAESRQVLERSFDGSLPQFIAAFLDGGKISDAEAEQIKQMIDRYRRNT